MVQINNYSKRHPTEKGTCWCVNCETWVEQSEMKSFWLDDDRTTQKLCPGCDLVLFEIVDDLD